jgi:hypothetical protein
MTGSGIAVGDLSHWLERRRHIGQLQECAVGTVYLALGAKLAFNER